MGPCVRRDDTECVLIVGLRRDQNVARSARWPLRRPVRRRTCGLLRAPIPSRSAAAGSAAVRRPGGRFRNASARARPCGGATAPRRRRVSTKPVSWQASSATRNAAKVDCGRPARDQQRLQAGAAAVVQQRGNPRQRQAGQFGQRRIEQFEIARQQRAQDQSGGELAGGAQVPHQAAHVLAARTRRDIDGRALARFAGDPPCAIGAEPVRATTNCASVSDSFATSASRVAAGRSSSTSIDSRIAAIWPCRSTMRSQENGASSA